MKKIMLLICSLILSTQCLAIESAPGNDVSAVDKLGNALSDSLRADNHPSQDLVKEQADDIIMVYGGKDLTNKTSQTLFLESRRA